MAVEPSIPSTQGRKRSESSRKAILAATYELLKSIGFHQMSIEGVAAHAGVGKATIYRWWGSKGVLAVEAFMAGIAPCIAFQESASARADIEQQMADLAKVYRGRSGEILIQMISYTRCDPEMRDALFSGYLQPRREAAKTALQRGIEQGEFLPDIDLEALVDALYGPLIYRMLTCYHPLDEHFVQQVSKTAFEGIMRNK